MRELKSNELKWGILVFVMITGIVAWAGYSSKSNVSPLEYRAMDAFSYVRVNDMNMNFCVLIDLNIHSGKKRLVVWDFKKNEVVKEGLVSHGCGDYTWGLDQTRIRRAKYSNVEGSHLSSLGKYEIGNRAWSNWGINIKYWLRGLEDSNNNAEKRVIVLHGWDSVTDVEVYPDGTPEGWGCPAVSNHVMEYLDGKLRGEDDVLLWIYNDEYDG